MPLAQHSTIPRALDALVALCRELFDPDVQIEDSAVGSWVKVDTLVVGTQVDGTASFAALGRRKREEEYDIECAFYVRGGDNDISSRRTRLFILFAALEQKLSDDPTLSGTVRWCEPTDFNLVGGYQTQQAKGTVSELTFKVHVRAPVYNTQGVTP